MRRMYLVRHGETNGNATNVVQDGTELLSDRGIKQAMRVAERVQHLNFQHFLVSDYKRTKQTAEPIIKSTGKDPIYTPLLREVRRPSGFVGMSNSSAEFQQFLRDATVRYHDSAWRHSDEENFSDVIARVEKFFAYVKTLEGDILVVSHGHLIRYMTMYVLHGCSLTADQWRSSEYRMWVSNTGITIFVEDMDHRMQPGWRLLSFNDHAHFAE